MDTGRRYAGWRFTKSHFPDTTGAFRYYGDDKGEWWCHIWMSGRIVRAWQEGGRHRANRMYKLLGITAERHGEMWAEFHKTYSA